MLGGRSSLWQVGSGDSDLQMAIGVVRRLWLIQGNVASHTDKHILVGNTD